MSQQRKPGTVALLWALWLGIAWFVLGGVGFWGEALWLFHTNVWVIALALGWVAFIPAVVMLIVGLVKRSTARPRPVYVVGEQPPAT